MVFTFEIATLVQSAISNKFVGEKCFPLHSLGRGKKMPRYCSDDISLFASILWWRFSTEWLYGVGQVLTTDGTFIANIPSDADKIAAWANEKCCHAVKFQRNPTNMRNEENRNNNDCSRTSPRVFFVCKRDCLPLKLQFLLEPPESVVSISKMLLHSSSLNMQLHFSWSMSGWRAFGKIDSVASKVNVFFQQRMF